MSTNSVETVLSRAMSDAAFAEELFANPEQSLAGYDLTAEEVAKFKNMTRAELNAMAGLAPDERKSMSFSWGMKSDGRIIDPNHNETALSVRK